MAGAWYPLCSGVGPRARHRPGPFAHNILRLRRQPIKGRPAVSIGEVCVQVAIVGLGYVGAVTAGCLARLGHTVVGVDLDPTKAEAVGAGTSPVAEPGLDRLLAEGVAAGRIRVAPISQAVASAELIMIAVGTPSAPSGALDLTAVLRVTEQIGGALPHDDRFRTVVVRSTVLPGTTEGQVGPCLEASSGMTAGVDFGLAMNPEFLREGTSIRDFGEAARTVVGANDPRSAEQTGAVYEGLPVPIEQVSIRTAEMVKYTDNAFHAMKIAFANEIGSVAIRLGVDGREAMRVLSTDHRLNISSAYLRPGYAFGGSCLPKDLRALTDLARKMDLDLPLLNAALQSNTAHFERGLRLVEEAGARNVALLGLSFKNGTDDLRESPAVALAERLIGRGYRLAIYDPDVQLDRLLGANRAFIENHLPHLVDLLRASLAEALSSAETVVVAKHWPDLDDLGAALGERQTVVDLVGIPGLESSAAKRYAGIGW
jgi:GDP-mannose 6-dehydrogenase